MTIPPESSKPVERPITDFLGNGLKRLEIVFPEPPDNDTFSPGLRGNQRLPFDYGQRAD